MTINPVYRYKDADGNVVKRPLSEKDQIPVNAKDRTLTKLGLCYERIEALKYGEDYEHLPADGIINVHPKICKMNNNKKTRGNNRSRCDVSLWMRKSGSQQQQQPRRTFKKL